ncbi:MAG: Asp-tRNA(Asn)/Glu-tRNA(Gln) amidotransferase subunit GatB [Candidatus Paceibacterota bacterium]|jgi:aspartyl-tRNA(Asn)/glutamyl-tRNA(Gln) amidotransferase subunit B
MTTTYLPTIGLEIHAELKTFSKMFCSCKNNPDEEKININVCPICMGHPGTLPVPNIEAIRHVLKVGLAVNGTLADFTEWDRKNYFYPDIPKGYQISQFKYPLVSGGILAGVELERIHLEEDTAQSTHDTHKNSLVNFNRAGVPLLELVTKPVIHDAVTAVNFAKELQLLLRYLGAGDANMEKGEMRVEANISIAPKTSSDLEKSPAGSSEASKSPEKFDLQKLGTKTEVKNLNSFKVVEKAIAYEIERQTSLLEAGDKVIQETRGWDEKLNETYSQRKKEGSHDYRYFPEPDIPKFKISEISEFSTDILKKDMVELPWIKRDRFKKDFAMTDKEVSMFIESPEIANYFEKVIEPFKNDLKRVKLSINYILSDYLGALNKKSGSFDIETISTQNFSELIQLIADAKVSSRGAKDLIAILLETPSGSNYSDKSALGDQTSASSLNKPDLEVKPLEITSVFELAQKHGLIQQNNTDDLIPAIEKIITENANVVSEYKAGKVTSLQFLIGQAMKATKGSANPEMVKKILLEKLV